MSTEVWFRNPYNYIRELVEVGHLNIAWDRGILVKRGIEPIKFAMTFCSGMDYRILTIGNQGSAEYRPGTDWTHPVAVYPTWSYGEDSIILEEMMEHPLGEDEEACNDDTVRDDERPVLGQPHRVIITDMPNAQSGTGRNFLRYLKILQEDHPECIIHVHGLYGWKTAFGLGFGAADVQPRDAAQKGRVHLPAGQVEKFERVVQKPQWAAALGFKPADLENPKQRCIFNIKSAIWAGEHYTELFKFKTQHGGSVDYQSSDADFTPEETAVAVRGKAQPGDKQVCDMCSLADKCKYYRSGAVCTVPGAEPVKLAQLFRTRDADQIINGLSMIVGAGAERLERTMQIEEDLGDFDPEVSKMMGQVFDQGVKLAKLLEPQRFSPGSKVQVNVGQGGAASISTANPRELVKNIFRELEAQGIPRENITEDMIKGAMEAMVNPERQHQAISGTTIQGETVPEKDAS